MCTVSFIPLKYGVIMTSNRDEHITRANTLYPEFYDFSDRQLVFPKDSLKGGTWFISNEKGDIGILLNGAFEKHISKPPYRKSRGCILPEIFQQECPLKALKQYDLKGIENFTIILWYQQQLWEIKWNGTLVYFCERNPKVSHIWSSVTLYTSTMIEERKQWFDLLLQSGKINDQQDILAFHTQSHIDNKEYGLLINRENKMVTISTTSLYLDRQSATLIHKDLIQGVDANLSYQIPLYAKSAFPANSSNQYAQNN